MGALGCRPPAPESYHPDGPETAHALTFKPDQLTRADQLTKLKRNQFLNRLNGLLKSENYNILVSELDDPKNKQYSIPDTFRIRSYRRAGLRKEAVALGEKIYSSTAENDSELATEYLWSLVSTGEMDKALSIALSFAEEAKIERQSMGFIHVFLRLLFSKGRMTDILAYTSKYMEIGKTSSVLYAYRAGAAFEEKDLDGYAGSVGKFKLRNLPPAHFGLKKNLFLYRVNELLKAENYDVLIAELDDPENKKYPVPATLTARAYLRTGTSDSAVKNNQILEGCAIVMAHPDDEVLWASSLLTRASKIILCFGAVPGAPRVQESRRRAIKAYPLINIDFLDLTEAGVFEMARWPLPRASTQGVEIPSKLFHRASSDAAKKYKQNFSDLCDALVERLTNTKDVVTHNPWGEYGHEEHVQVFNAVVYAQQRLGFNVWVTNYVSKKTVPFMLKQLACLGQPTEMQEISRSFVEEIMQIYIRTGCWTWSNNYIWPQYEAFFPLKKTMELNRGDIILPINYIGF